MLSANGEQPIQRNLSFAAHSDVSRELILRRWETSVFDAKESVLIVVLKPFDADFAAILLGYFGWGGRIRTFTGLINSEVPYQLDHAPAASAAKIASTSQGRLRRTE